MKRSCMSFLVLAVLLTGWSAVAAAQATITSISPTTIQAGGSLTIFGSGFGASQGLSNSISFTGVPASPRVVASSWTATKIVVTMPASAISGTVSVVVSSRASNTVPLTVTPVVNSVTPAAALPGTQVTVAGSGFGNTQAIGSSSIAFNGVSVVPSTWSSTSIVVTVPGNATSGIVMATVAGQSSSNSVVFTPIPNIATISPAQAAAGTQVTINGNSFGTAQGSSSVAFNGVAAQVTNWTNSTLQAVVPNTSSGPVTVQVNGVSSNSTAFAVSPGIISISPDPGMAGSPVTISGTAFGSTQGSSTITFNGLAAAVTNWSNSAIAAIVPPNVTAGPVQVTVNGMASNGVGFSLPSPYNFAVSYAPDGAILGATDSVNGTWNYTYDDFNRLATANRTDVPTGLGFQYDQYGNRWQQNVTGGIVGSSQMTFNPAPTAFRNGNCYHPAGLNNQPDAYCYDAAGNLLSDGVHTYTYDAENSVISVDAGQTATYLYNGMGQRVSKGTGASAAEFLYDLNGNLITEVSGSGNWIRGEIYSVHKHVGTYKDGTTYFTQADWLGTERARVYFNGNLFQTCTNLPFGDGLNCSGASDPSPDHFTGKERDAESGNDYFGARYYESTMGRFMSADWSVKEDPVPYAKLDYPQSLNLYSYVGNNPIGSVDSDGHACSRWLGNSDSNFCKRAAEYAGPMFDGNPKISSQTRFFAATSAVSLALADVNAWSIGSRSFVSEKTASFLEGIGQDLEKMNFGIIKQIKEGSLQGSNLDSQLVHMEQTEVQKQLDALRTSDPKRYDKTIKEINGALNPGIAGTFLSTRFATDKAYEGVLNGVRNSLRRDIDFSNQGDREAIGNALAQHARTPSGCDMTGKQGKQGC